MKLNKMKIKILVILIVLVSLGVGGFFIWKNISNLKKVEVPSEPKEQLLEEDIIESKEKLEEKERTQSKLEIPESAKKFEFGYCTGGAWNIPLGYLQKNRNDWNPISVMWERAMPGFAMWQQIEPEKGKYNWEKIDEYVKGAQERNIQTLITIQPFTDWDQETCNMHLEWRSDTGGKDPRDFLSHAHRKGKPCDMEAYKEFLRKLVERYDYDGIDDMSGLLYPVTHWEIGNEPDVGDDFQGSAEDYFEILKVSYITIKETDSNAKILIAAIGIHGFEQTDYDKWDSNFDTLKLFELGATNYFDIMNGHSFGGQKLKREFLKKYGAGDKPIWVTEPTGVRHYQDQAETDEELALVLVQIFTEASKHGVTMFFLGGSEKNIPVLHNAVHYIRYGELKFSKDEENKEKIDRKIVGKCDCNALYDFYNIGIEVQEYAEAIREDCNNACGLTNEMDKGGCYSMLARSLYENGIWIGDCLCRDASTGKVRDWCYAHSTVVLHQGNLCDKIQDPEIKAWCMNPPR